MVLWCEKESWVCWPCPGMVVFLIFYMFNTLFNTYFFLVCCVGTEWDLKEKHFFGIGFFCFRSSVLFQSFWRRGFQTHPSKFNVGDLRWPVHGWFCHQYSLHHQPTHYREHGIRGAGLWRFVWRDDVRDIGLFHAACWWYSWLSVPIPSIQIPSLYRSVCGAFVWFVYFTMSTHDQC